MAGCNVPPPKDSRNRRLLTAAALSVIVGTASACFGDLADVEGATDTDPANPPCFQQGMCDGVLVYCENPPAPDGSDNGQNYWWVPWGTVGSLCEHSPVITEAGCMEDDWWCCPDGVEGVEGVENTCYCKQYSVKTDPPNQTAIGDMGPLCVGRDFPAPVDELNDWVSGSYPTIDADIRSWCSDHCGMKNKMNHPDPDEAAQCQDANWSGHKTIGGWAPNDEHNCVVTMQLNGTDPDGSEVPWDLVGGPATPIPLSCDLTDDCSQWFYPPVGEFVVTIGTADFIDFETRTAHYLGVEATGSQLAIDMPGNNDDANAMYGMAEYTALDCGQTACPFYLANLSAYNTTDSWSIKVDTVTGKENKTFSNVQIDLIQSTLGVHNTSLDVVAFAPGALRFIVEFTVEGTGTGAGTHYYVIENDDYIFAEYAAGDLDLTHTFPIQSGDATLTVSVVPSEHPPVASHDLAATEACDSSGGLLLRGRNLSTDADNDIVSEMWWIDGAQCTSNCVVPLGNHVIQLEAHDSRGAVDLADAHSINVTGAAPCAI